MISNWVKEMGIDAGCEMCLVTELANDRLKVEVAEGEALAVELAHERANYRQAALHWKNVACLSMTALAGLMVIVALGWVR